MNILNNDNISTYVHIKYENGKLRRNDNWQQKQNKANKTTMEARKENTKNRLEWLRWELRELDKSEWNIHWKL